jgi:TRAP transporter TAXI family solute receptor
MKAIVPLWLLILSLVSCHPQNSRYKIAGSIEEPQNEIANTIAGLVSEKLGEQVDVTAGNGSLASIDSLEAGTVDFAIVDNYSRYSNKVSSLMPLYPQVLHILYRKDRLPVTLQELLLSGKIFAGIPGSGAYNFVKQLSRDLGLERSKIEFVDALSLFEADVIFSFTDLLTLDELRDLTDFQLFSIDAVENLGKGSLAEGLCTRYPQFEPYVIPKEVYGRYTEKAVLTIKVDAVLVCRRTLSDKLIYKVLETITENRENLQKINPLLYHVTTDYDVRELNFRLHPGARNYLNRYEPSFIEKYAEVFSVILTIALAIASSLYTISRWQKGRKKNKIDVYYQKLIAIRGMIPDSTSITQIEQLEQSLINVQEETIQLVVREKLMADESFSIFLNLSKIVMDEIRLRKESFTSGSIYQKQP